MFENVAKTEVVTPHCWMMTLVECSHVFRTVFGDNKPPSRFIAEEYVLCTLLFQRSPAAETLSYVGWDTRGIMPKLNNNPWYWLGPRGFLCFTSGQPDQTSYVL
jgi:hypothetical protein